MILSFFDHVKDSRPRQVEMTWAEILQGLGQHRPTRDKAGVPLWNATDFGGQARKKINARTVSLMILDIDGEAGRHDGLPFRRFQELLARLSAEGLEYAAVSSHGHGAVAGQGAVKARVILPLASPVPAANWRTFWYGFVQHFDAPADSQCSDVNRAYFVPSCPPEDAGVAFFIRVPGAPVDPGRYQLSVAPAGLAYPANADMLRDLASRLQRNPKGDRQAAGYALAQALEGLPFAQPGHRDETTWILAKEIAQAFPDVDPETVAPLLSASFSQLGDDAPDEEAFVEKLTRAQEHSREGAVLGPVGAEARMRETGRSGPYTSDELREFGDMTHRWVVTHEQTGTWFFVNGGYVGPVSDAKAKTAARAYLAPASSAGVQLSGVDDRGRMTEKPADTLMMQYGRTVASVSYDLTLEKTKLADNELVCCVPRREPAKPQADPKIAQWLRHLAGDTDEGERALLDWLATLTRLDRPAPALLLIGVAGSGKGLLASGLSRIWTDKGTTSMKSILDTSFNERLMNCPLIFADEEIPKHHGGRPKTEALRELITTQVHTFKRKFQAENTLVGAVRVVIGANTLGSIFSMAELASTDIQALTDRFIFLQPTAGARDLLESVPPEVKDAWVEGDGIARHVAWLRENWAPRPGRRLIVPAYAQDLARSLAVSTGQRWAVLQWLYEFCKSPLMHYQSARPGEQLAAQWVELQHRWGQVPPWQTRHLVVVPARIPGAWSQYASGPAPAGEVVSSAIRLLASSRERYPLPGGGWGYVLTPEDLIVWAETADESPEPVQRGFAQGPLRPTGALTQDEAMAATFAQRLN